MRSPRPTGRSTASRARPGARRSSCALTRSRSEPHPPLRSPPVLGPAHTPALSLSKHGLGAIVGCKSESALHRSTVVSAQCGVAFCALPPSACAIDKLRKTQTAWLAPSRTRDGLVGLGAVG